MKSGNWFLFLAAAGLFALSVTVGGRELSAIRFSRLPLADRFDKISNSEIPEAYSLRSERIVLNACRRAITATFAKLQPTVLRNRVSRNCAELSGRIGRAEPSASYAHYVRSLALFEQRDIAGFNLAFSLSWKTGPNEGWIAKRRFTLGERGLDMLDTPASVMHARDVALLVSSQRGLPLVAKSYVGEPASRDRLTAIVETLPEQVQRRFLSAVRKELRRSASGS